MAQPRYTLIAGDFYILYPDLPGNGPEPDGDTINFLPDHDGLVQNLQRFSNKAPDRRHLGTYPVRFEGIDTLERISPITGSTKISSSLRPHAITCCSSWGSGRSRSCQAANAIRSPQPSTTRSAAICSPTASKATAASSVWCTQVSRRPHWAPTTATACSSPPTSSTPASTPNTSVTAWPTASFTTRCRSHLPTTSPRP